MSFTPAFTPAFSRPRSHIGLSPLRAQIIELLSRDPRGDDKHPFQAAMDDCLMITIKGVAAGMQNTG